MIADFHRMSGPTLSAKSAASRKRSGINDPSHFAYPTYAKVCDPIA